MQIQKSEDKTADEALWPAGTVAIRVAALATVSLKILTGFSCSLSILISHTWVVLPT
jgi:hypothetical protein